MSNVRALLTTSTVALAAVAGTLALAPTATAVTTSLCGSTYNYVGKHAMKRVSGTGGPSTGGYVYVYYSPKTQQNCAIAKPVSDLRGKAWGLGVGLHSPKYKRGQSDGYASGQVYTRWAGPVYVKAPHACINVVGDMNAGRAHYAVTKEGVHCG
ncbi:MULTISPECIES: hypothetical protein [unclassified Streptomyces]|uniref:hypothetical protein n=1 Tax=unclassified Streptomyces TaxID=2593676 RepID=UPI0004C718D3|nr:MULTISPECIES: hypothetical protein [unclassified Streptomyces]KOV73395.1 hypothetical protein ADL02_40210 [Streptomyces sp. NRRL WC-3723]